MKPVFAHRFTVLIGLVFICLQDLQISVVAGSTNAEQIFGYNETEKKKNEMPEDVSSVYAEPSDGDSMFKNQQYGHFQEEEIFGSNSNVQPESFNKLEGKSGSLQPYGNEFISTEGLEVTDDHFGKYSNKTKRSNNTITLPIKMDQIKQNHHLGLIVEKSSYPYIQEKPQQNFDSANLNYGYDSSQSGQVPHSQKEAEQNVYPVNLYYGYDSPQRQQMPHAQIEQEQKFDPVNLYYGYDSSKSHEMPPTQKDSKQNFDPVDLYYGYDRSKNQLIPNMQKDPEKDFDPANLYYGYESSKSQQMPDNYYGWIKNKVQHDPRGQSNQNPKYLDMRWKFSQIPGKKYKRQKLYRDDFENDEDQQMSGNLFENFNNKIPNTPGQFNPVNYPDSYGLRPVYPNVQQEPERQYQSQKLNEKNFENMKGLQIPGNYFENFKNNIQSNALVDRHGQIDQENQNKNFGSSVSLSGYPNIQKNGLNFTDNELKGNKNINYVKHLSKNTDLQFLQGYPDNGNGNLNILQEAKQKSKNLQKVFEYAENETREDIYAPKEWNSSSLISTNLRFERNTDFKNDNINKFTKNDSHFPSRTNRNIRKREEDSKKDEAFSVKMETTNVPKIALKESTDTKTDKKTFFTEISTEITTIDNDDNTHKTINNHKNGFKKNKRSSVKGKYNSWRQTKQAHSDDPFTKKRHKRSLTRDSQAIEKPLFEKRLSKSKIISPRSRYPYTQHNSDQMFDPANLYYGYDSPQSQQMLLPQKEAEKSVDPANLYYGYDNSMSQQLQPMQKQPQQKFASANSYYNYDTSKAQQMSNIQKKPDQNFNPVNLYYGYYKSKSQEMPGIQKQPEKSFEPVNLYYGYKRRSVKGNYNALMQNQSLPKHKYLEDSFTKIRHKRSLKMDSEAKKKRESKKKTENVPMTSGQFRKINNEMKISNDSIAQPTKIDQMKQKRHLSLKVPRSRSPYTQQKGQTYDPSSLYYGNDSPQSQQMPFVQKEAEQNFDPVNLYYSYDSSLSQQIPDMQKKPEQKLAPANLYYNYGKSQGQQMSHTQKEPGQNFNPVNLYYGYDNYKSQQMPGIQKEPQKSFQPVNLYYGYKRRSVNGKHNSFKQKKSLSKQVYTKDSFTKRKHKRSLRTNSEANEKSQFDKIISKGDDRNIQPDKNKMKIPNDTIAQLTKMDQMEQKHHLSLRIPRSRYPYMEQNSEQNFDPASLYYVNDSPQSQQKPLAQNEAEQNFDPGNLYYGYDSPLSQQIPYVQKKPEQKLTPANLYYNYGRSQGQQMSHIQKEPGQYFNPANLYYAYDNYKSQQMPGIQKEPEKSFEPVNLYYGYKRRSVSGKHNSFRQKKSLPKQVYTKDSFRKRKNKRNLRTDSEANEKPQFEKILSKADDGNIQPDNNNMKIPNDTIAQSTKIDQMEQKHHLSLRIPRSRYPYMQQNSEQNFDPASLYYGNDSPQNQQIPLVQKEEEQIFDPANLYYGYDSSLSQQIPYMQKTPEQKLAPANLYYNYGKSQGQRMSHIQKEPGQNFNPANLYYGYDNYKSQQMPGIQKEPEQSFEPVNLYYGYKRRSVNGKRNSFGQKKSLPKQVYTKDSFTKRKHKRSLRTDSEANEKPQFEKSLSKSKIISTSTVSIIQPGNFNKLEQVSASRNPYGNDIINTKDLQTRDVQFKKLNNGTKISNDSIAKPTKIDQTEQKHHHRLRVPVSRYPYMQQNFDPANLYYGYDSNHDKKIPPVQKEPEQVFDPANLYYGYDNSMSQEVPLIQKQPEQKFGPENLYYNYDSFKSQQMSQKQKEPEQNFNPANFYYGYDNYKSQQIPGMKKEAGKSFEPANLYYGYKRRSLNGKHNSFRQKKSLPKQLYIKDSFTKRLHKRSLRTDSEANEKPQLEKSLSKSKIISKADDKNIQPDNNEMKISNDTIAQPNKIDQVKQKHHLGLRVPRSRYAYTQQNSDQIFDPANLYYGYDNPQSQQMPLAQKEAEQNFDPSNLYYGYDNSMSQQVQPIQKQPQQKFASANSYYNYDSSKAQQMSPIQKEPGRNFNPVNLYYSYYNSKSQQMPGIQKQPEKSFKPVNLYYGYKRRSVNDKYNSLRQKKSLAKQAYLNGSFTKRRRKRSFKTDSEGNENPQLEKSLSKSNIVPRTEGMKNRVKKISSQISKFQTLLPNHLPPEIKRVIPPFTVTSNNENILSLKTEFSNMGTETNTFNITHKNFPVHLINIYSKSPNDGELKNTSLFLDNQNKRLSLRAINELYPEDLDSLIKLLQSNASIVDNNTYIEFEGEKALYILNVTSKVNGSFPREIEIIRRFEKSNFWDNVHYVNEIETLTKKSPVCCESFLAFIRRNPFTVALVMSALCIIVVVMLIYLFFMSERRMRKNEEERSKRDYSGYKIIKKKKGTTKGKVLESLGAKKQKMFGKRSHLKTPDKSNSSESSESEEKSDNNMDLNIHKTETQITEKDKDEKNGEDDNEQQTLLKSRWKSPKNFITKTKRWMQKRFSTVPPSDSQSDVEKSRSEEISESDPDTDKTYARKRDRVKRYVKSRGGRKKTPASASSSKIVAPDLKSTMKEIKDHLTEDETCLPNTYEDLKKKIVTTGDREQIDNMLTRGDWDKTFNTAHGLSKRTDEMELSNHTPKEKRKLDVEKLEEVSLKSVREFGTLPKGSSANSLKRAAEKSMNTAEWVSKQPKPESNTVLKQKFEQK